MPVVVEFAGIPCSGKSTAYENSKEYFSAKGFVRAEDFFAEFIARIPYTRGFLEFHFVNMLTRIGILVWIHLLQILSTPGLYWRIGREIAHSDKKAKVARSVFFKLGKAILIQKRCTQSVYMDEGVIQMLFAIFIPSPGTPERLDQIGTFLRILPLPDTVIVGPDGPEEEFVRRLLVRGHHRITGNRHTKEKLAQPALENTELRKRARHYIAQCSSIQRSLLREMEGRIDVRRFRDIGL